MAILCRTRLETVIMNKVEIKAEHDIRIDPPNSSFKNYIMYQNGRKIKD